jgi:hypothetical protein
MACNPKGWQKPVAVWGRGQRPPGSASPGDHTQAGWQNMRLQFRLALGTHPCTEKEKGVKPRQCAFFLDPAPGLGHRRTMPRQLRIQYPGAMYHVVSRGNRREDIRSDAWEQTGRRVHVRYPMSSRFRPVVRPLPGQPTTRSAGEPRGL